jgi:ABC-type methionine transport system permease subunit
MSPFEKMVIDLKSAYSSWEIMYIYRKQHWDYVGCDCMKCYFACVKGLPLGVLLLEGQDGQTWNDHVQNCTFCHLLNMDGQIDLFSTIVYASFWCMLFGQFLGLITMLVCDQCLRGWHMGCIIPSLNETLVKKWFCIWCMT